MRSIDSLLRTVLLFSAAMATCAAAAPAPVPQASAENIVVTARRSGIPVWRVRGGQSDLILVGTIEDVAKGANWNPESLLVALRQADQVMFPQTVRYTGGFFSIANTSNKVRRMERFPRGQTLADFTTPAQFQRLLSLQKRRLLAPGFEQRRPLYVAYDLMEQGKGLRPSHSFLSISRVDVRTDPDAFIRSAIKKYNLRLVPMRTQTLKAAMARLAAAPPVQQVPCLFAAADFAEAGPAAFHARSQAWADRRVRDVVNSPAEKAYVTCAAIIRDLHSPAELQSTIMQVLRQPAVTVAVLELSALARDGAILDQLQRNGFDVSGPPWR